MGMTDENKGGLIAAGASLLGQGINWASQGSMNKKTREWSEKMYGLQRQNALADWNMQNAYNSPSEQMQRFKAAGLNPNLIYGQTSEAPAVRSAPAPNWNPQAPQFNPGAISGSYFDTAIKKQTLTNMDAQEKVLRQQALNLASDLVTKGIVQNRGKLAYDIESATRENVIARSGLQNDILKVQPDNMLWDRELKKKTLDKVVEQIALTKSQTAESKARRAQILTNVQNAIKDGVIKDFEIKLNKMNITKSDPAYLRLLDGLVEEIMAQ